MGLILHGLGFLCLLQGKAFRLHAFIGLGGVHLEKTERESRFLQLLFAACDHMTLMFEISGNFVTRCCEN